MQRVKTLGLALVAVLALSGLAVSSASASLFLAHPTSGSFPALILDININSKGEVSKHKFTTEAGKVVECTSAKSHGIAEFLRALTQKETVIYSECTAFGFVVSSVSPAEYEFSADLKVTQLNTVIITVKSITPCSVTVSPAGNANLDGVHYGSDPADPSRLIINALVKGITAFIKGSECGKVGTTKTAEYVGQSLAWLENGGKLGWDK